MPDKISGFYTTEFKVYGDGSGGEHYRFSAEHHRRLNTSTEQIGLTVAKDGRYDGVTLSWEELQAFILSHPKCRSFDGFHGRVPITSTRRKENKNDN